MGQTQSKPDKETHRDLKAFLKWIQNGGELHRWNYPAIIPDSVARCYIMGLAAQNEPLYIRAGSQYNPKGMEREIRLKFEAVHIAFLRLFVVDADIPIEIPFQQRLFREPGENWSDHRWFGLPSPNIDHNNGLLITLTPEAQERRRVEGRDADPEYFDINNETNPDEIFLEEPNTPIDNYLRQLAFYKKALFLVLNRDNVHSVRWGKYFLCFNTRGTLHET